METRLIDGPPLAACPFCGETTNLGIDYDDEPHTAFGGYRVICRTCGGIGPADNACSDDVSREQAVANWNRRPASTLTINGRPVADVVGAISPGTGAMLPSTSHVLQYKPMTVDELRAAGVTMVDGNKLGGKWTASAVICGECGVRTHRAGLCSKPCPGSYW